MPVVGETGNRITWNHFFFVEGGPGLPACRFDPRHTLDHQAPFDETTSHISNLRIQAYGSTGVVLCSATYLLTYPSKAADSAARVWPVRPTFLPSISLAGSKLRVVEVMNTSSAASRSEGVRSFSISSIPGTGTSPNRSSRVMPGRQPALSGGVHTWLPTAAKMLADVHSATWPCSLRRTTSSRPRACACSTQVRL